MSEDAPRRGWNIMHVLVTIALAALMILIARPALNYWREDKADLQRRRETSFLRQLGQACIWYAEQADGRLPESLDAVAGELGPDYADQWRRVVYVGAGKSAESGRSDEVLAYMIVQNPDPPGGVNAVHMDGHVEFLIREQLEERLAAHRPESRPTSQPASR